MTASDTPGWHPDPAGSDQFRYWDGTAWTDKLRDADNIGEAPTTEWPAPKATWPPPVGDQPVGTNPAPGEREDDNERKPGLVTRARQHPRVLASAGGLLLLALLTGSFFLGQSTRKAPDVVRTEKATAVQEAVNRTRAAERKVRLNAVKSAIEKTQKRSRTVIRRVVRKLKESGDRKAAASYAAGSSSGYSSGFNSGEQNGLEKATDGVTCSDDVDVTWLPYCY